jgi:integrase
MGRATLRLNDTQINKAKPKEKDYTLSDGEGLQLLIKNNGSKLWEFYYKRLDNGKRRKTSFGIYPTVKLKNARIKKQSYLDLLHSGIDPIDHHKEIKQKQKETERKKHHTIGKVIDDYFNYKQKSENLKDETTTKDKARLINHFVSFLSQKEKTNFHTITFPEIKKTLMRLEESNKLDTLSKVKRLISKVWNYAYTQGITEDTAIYAKAEMYQIVKKQEIRNNPTLTKKEEIKKIYNDILNYSHSYIVRSLLIVTIHTAQRQGSIIRAEWSEIDFENKLWIIPKDKMKGRAHKVKEHRLPLSDHLIKHLEELHEITGDGKYLFPNSQTNSTRNKYPHISNNTVTKALRAMGYSKEEQTAHGFRAMFKTVCKEHQESHHLNNEFVEKVLAHKVEGEVESAYTRAQNIEDKRKIVEWWSNYLEGLRDVR